MKKFKLAALDIDGTLAGPNGLISKQNIETIRAVEDAGGIVTVCTGRNIRRALPVIRELRLKVPYACMDGLALVDAVTSNIMKDYLLSPEEVEAILQALERLPVFLELSDGDKYYKYTPDKALYRYDMFTQNTWKGRLRNHQEGIRYVHRLQRLYGLKGHCYHLIVIGEDEVLAEAKKILAAFPEIDVRDDLWPHYLFINRKGIKKAHGVTLLCEHFGVSLEETIAIGDGTNDIDMLQHVGLGIAMGNAEKRVKDAAAEVTATNAEDGVALALRKYFL